MFEQGLVFPGNVLEETVAKGKVLSKLENPSEQEEKKLLAYYVFCQTGYDLTEAIAKAVVSNRHSFIQKVEMARSYFKSFNL